MGKIKSLILKTHVGIDNKNERVEHREKWGQRERERVNEKEEKISEIATFWISSVYVKIVFFNSKILDH